MRFPFVLLSQHEEVLRILEAFAALKDQRIAELESLNKTLLNQVWVGQFGEPLFPQPGAMNVVSSPEPPMTDIQKLEAEAGAERQQELARLASIRRSSPSKLAPAISKVMAKDMMARANAAARPRPATPAKEIFAQAESEVES